MHVHSCAWAAWPAWRGPDAHDVRCLAPCGGAAAGLPPDAASALTTGRIPCDVMAASSSFSLLSSDVTTRGASSPSPGLLCSALSTWQKLWSVGRVPPVSQERHAERRRSSVSSDSRGIRSRGRASSRGLAGAAEGVVFAEMIGAGASLVGAAEGGASTTALSTHSPALPPCRRRPPAHAPWVLRPRYYSHEGHTGAPENGAFTRRRTRTGGTTWGFAVAGLNQPP